MQADQEIKGLGVDPTKGIASMPKRLGSETLKKIRIAVKDDGQRFPKIENVFIYEHLGISMPPIYILDDRKEIDALAAGRISQGLKSDLEHLIRGSLVIRSDITDRNLQKDNCYLVLMNCGT